MKYIFDLIAAFSLTRLLDVLWDVIKRYFIEAYVVLVEKLRSFYIIAVLTSLSLMLAFAGFLLLHIGIFWALSWSETAEGILLLGLSIVYMLSPLIAFLFIHSRRNWLKQTGAQKVLDDLSKKS